MHFPPFQERLLHAVSPVCERYGLVLAGGYAIKAHGFTDRPSKDLDFATAMELPLPDVANVLGLDDAVGLKMRAVHERSLARDIIDVAAVAHLYSYRALEQLAAMHHEFFSVYDLLARLEFVDLMDDEAFEAYGVGEERIKEIRRFAQGWVDDIKWRRADDGDVDYDADDLPDID
ncbi:hypothetical protein [Nonomuraea sp. B19D2]|uniref:hypothetical protein n=1 Tax=Nonomuraea sp. B19D2 TaxID=3159561 RepID=UPI0032DA623C